MWLSNLDRKYGNVHRQLRSLVILDFLVQNAGDRFLRGFADEALLERLRIAATDSVSDPLVKAKCRQIFGQWAETFKDAPDMAKIRALYRQLPKRKQPTTQAKTKVRREDPNNSDDHPIGHVVSVSAGTGPSTVLGSPKLKSKSKKDKKKKAAPSSGGNFDLEKERPALFKALAASSVASTDLLNALKLVNREAHRVGEDPECIRRFKVCKDLRHQILRYIQYVESEEFLGGLIHANEELVTALMTFDVLDRSVDDDSDSENEILEGRGHNRNMSDGLAGLNINSPTSPRAAPLASSSQHARQVYSESESESEDEDNPFGDSNAIRTPRLEQTGHTW